MHSSKKHAKLKTPELRGNFRKEVKEIAGLHAWAKPTQRAMDIYLNGLLGLSLYFKYILFYLRYYTIAAPSYICAVSIVFNATRSSAILPVADGVIALKR
jgi:hypothetical protein